MTAMRKGKPSLWLLAGQKGNFTWGINSQSAVGWGDIQFLPNGWNCKSNFVGMKIYKLIFLVKRRKEDEVRNLFLVLQLKI